MRKTLLAFLSSAMFATAVPFAIAKPQVAAPTPAAPPRGQGHFMGPHPVSGQPGAGYCYIEVPHVHDYLPDHPALYQQAGDNYVFASDPVPFGYQGDKTVFYGHHPVPLYNDPEDGAPPPRLTFCFMKGPHYHDYPAPEGPGFKEQNHVVFYVGPVPPDVARDRPKIEQALETEYRPYVAERPKVVVTPPPEWAGAVWVPPPAPTVAAAPATTPIIEGDVPAPPAVEAHVGAPVVEAHVGAPAVVVTGPAAPSVVVAAPGPPAIVVAPPAPAVIVAPPHPGAVIIGAPRPGGVFIEGHGHGHGGWGHGPVFRGGGRGHWKHW